MSSDSAAMPRWTSERDGVLAVVCARREAASELLDVRVECSGGGMGSLQALVDRVRHESSRDQLAMHGLDLGFRVEDLIAVELCGPGEDERPSALAWLARRLGRETPLRCGAPSPRWSLAVTFAPRGLKGTSQRARYEQVGGRMRIEAFELHAVEHCNLRCAHCCNMSPYVAEKILSAAEIGSLCDAMAAHLLVDVFKIMGGEPLLHPDMAGVLRAVRASGISDTIRLFTNGLLLHRMGDEFWAALDELTISSYASAPVKPATLRLAEDKARSFDVVLNVKPVHSFSEVLRAGREADDAAVRRTYDECWLRHRCIVVRRGRFYMCTRSAYADDFHRTILRGAHPEDHALALAGDGIPIDAEGFGATVLAYMNRAEPLASCRFCHGSSGPVAPHQQLSKADVRAGRLHVLRDA